MKKHIVGSSVIFLLIFTAINSGYSQQSSDASQAAMEQRYSEFITSALRLQVKADSLTRAANLDRRSLAFSGNDQERERLGNQAMLNERESFRVQRQADSLYSLAREIEERLMAAGRRQSGGSQGRIPGPAPSFLVLGDRNIFPGLSPGEQLKAMDLEKDYARANELMQEVTGITDYMEQLVIILDTRPRRRERRRINREIDDLRSRSFDMKMEAMQVYEKVNALRYNAAVSFLKEQRKQVADSLVLRSGLKHEELAGESFRQAAGLRETALDLRSDKYLEGFILRAYTEELKAFSEMGKALEIYQTPPAPVPAQMRELPLQAGGRVDAGTALSRSRLAATAAAASGNFSPGTDAGIQNAPFIDYGFSVLAQSPYSAANPLPAGFRLPDGLVYSIQLGIFRTILTPDSFGGLYPVMSSREPDNRAIRYLTGVFRSLPEAEKALVEVNRQGFADAFVVAFNSGDKMPVSRARQMERERQARAQAASRASEESRNQPPDDALLLAQTSEAPGTDRVVFKIQLGAFREIVQTGVHLNWQRLAGNKNVQHVRNNNGLYVYSIGNFNTFEDASLMLNDLRKQGISDAFVVPYRGDVRITMEEANRLMLLY